MLQLLRGKCIQVSPDTADPLLALPREDQLLDPDHAHAEPRPAALPVPAQPREQDLHRGPGAQHPPARARGQPPVSLQPEVAEARQVLAAAES